MDIGERLHIYKGILGNKNNSVEMRFVLVKAFRDNNYGENLYRGFRFDNEALANLEDGEVCEDLTTTYSDVSDSFRESIFVRLVDSKYFCDVLDNYCVCTLVPENNYEVYHGCVGVSKIEPKELVKFKSSDRRR
ncbi:MAG: hypothetical protein PUC82_03840 [bacterium]|nr:hypothetical protein [bacterium]